MTLVWLSWWKTLITTLPRGGYGPGADVGADLKVVLVEGAIADALLEVLDVPEWLWIWLANSVQMAAKRLRLVIRYTRSTINLRMLNLLRCHGAWNFAARTS